MRSFSIVALIGLLAFPTAGNTASPDPLREANQHYRNYQDAAERTGRKLPRSTKAVNQSLKRLTKYKPIDLGQGWIAEGARQASRNLVFRNGVTDAVARAGGASKFAAQLDANPISVMKIPGAGNGLRAAFNNIKRDDGYYDWLSGSLEAIAKGNKTNKAPAFGTVVIPRPKPGAGGANRQIVNSSISKAPLHSMGQKNNLSVVGRMMMLAALDIAGATRTGKGISRAKALLDNPPMTRCLSLARQNLNQCLAASRGKAEKQFCAGQHAVGEVSGCFDWILPPNY